MIAAFMGVVYQAFSESNRAGEGPELDDSIAVTAADVELHHISASDAP